MIFRSEVWHQGTANTSDRVRYLLQVHYAQRIITQKYPPYLNRFRFDPDILARATPRQLRLHGGPQAEQLRLRPANGRLGMKPGRGEPAP